MWTMKGSCLNLFSWLPVEWGIDSRIISCSDWLIWCATFVISYSTCPPLMCVKFWGQGNYELFVLAKFSSSSQYEETQLRFLCWWFFFAQNRTVSSLWCLSQEVPLPSSSHRFVSMNSFMVDSNDTWRITLAMHFYKWMIAYLFIVVQTSQISASSTLNLTFGKMWRYFMLWTLKKCDGESDI